MNPISIIILADEGITCESLRSFLQCSSNLNVIAATAKVEEVLAWISRSRAGLVLIDMDLPICAVHAAARILNAAPATHVAVLSRHADVPLVAHVITAELRRIGASALLSKNTSGRELLDAIERIAIGDAVFPVDGEGGPQSPARPMVPQTGLTVRQTQVLKFVAQGLANKEIADRLSISPKTVDKHRQSVKEKLRINNAADLARRAIILGLVQAA